MDRKDSENLIIKNLIKIPGIKSKTTSHEPFLPSVLEEALKAFKYGDGRKLDTYRRRVIQQIIDGSFNVLNPVALANRILLNIGLSQEEALRLRERSLELCRKISPYDIEFCEIINGLKSLFKYLDLSRVISGSQVSIFSLGCGFSPEASLCLDYFGERLKEFRGFDKNARSIERAKELNTVDQRLSFEAKDLARDFPEGNPDLIIIRHPDVYLYEKEGQKTLNQDWEEIFKRMKKQYPNSALLITTLMPAEAEKSVQWLEEPETSIRKSPFAVPFTTTFKQYGTFNLPVAADQYFIFVQPTQS